MKKIISLIAIMLIAITLNAGSVINNDKDYAEFTTYYYLNPQLDKIIPSINYYVNSDLYDKSNARTIMAHFYASILKDESSLLEQLFNIQSQSGTMKSRIFTLNILWLIDNSLSRRLMKQAQGSWNEERIQRIIQKMDKAPKYDVLNKNITTAADLDNLWGIFYVTGNEDVIKKIIDVIHLREDGSGMQIVIGGAAYWSLKSNTGFHKKVLDIIKIEATRSKGTTKELLEEIISDVDGVNNNDRSER